MSSEHMNDKNTRYAFYFEQAAQEGPDCGDPYVISTGFNVILTSKKEFICATHILSETKGYPSVYYASLTDGFKVVRTYTRPEMKEFLEEHNFDLKKADRVYAMLTGNAPVQ
jgi:tRNA/tmRNA/rRNA uracil-C5-methylase (TrmA/RlmC/RlmD family)